MVGLGIHDERFKQACGTDACGNAVEFAFGDLPFLQRLELDDWNVAAIEDRRGVSVVRHS